MSVLSFIFVLTCLPAALMDFTLPKWRADPSFRIDDAYKWTYQATRGGEHAIPDARSAGKWLLSEWTSLSQNVDEPIWEPICPNGEIGRLNLRPFKARQGDPEDLLAAFLESSRLYRSDAGTFLAAWNELGRRLKNRPAGKLYYADWIELDLRMKAKNYPAIHHSGPYRMVHSPAYRIITLAEAKKLLAIAE